MTDAEKYEPLVLADELAALARRNTPMTWLADAVAKLNELPKLLPIADEQKFEARMTDGRLELWSFRRHKGLDVFASYYLRDSGLAFGLAHEVSTANPALSAPDWIGTEDDFIRHIVGTVAAKFGLTNQAVMRTAA